MIQSQTRSKSPDRLAHTPVRGAGATPAGRSNLPKLKIGPCSRKAAKYAVENWHYSKSLPASGLFLIGVWEAETFIGCIIFSRGANNNMGKRIGLPDPRHCVELTRVALNKHQHTVTHIVKAAFKELRKHNPGIRAVMSYADPEQGHHGGIYQAGGWTYIGRSGAMPNFYINGKRMHPKSIASKYGTNDLNKIKNMGVNIQKTKSEPKHTYAIGFDRQMKNRLKKMKQQNPPRTSASTTERENIQKN